MAYAFSDDGVALVSETGRSMSYIDTSGRKISNEEFGVESQGFTNGVAVAQSLSTGDYGILNTQGVFLVDPTFWKIPNHLDLTGTQKGYFSEGIEAVEDSKGWKYVDSNGGTVIDGNFAKARSFSNGLAFVQDEASGLWGYIDLSGVYVIEPQYEENGHLVNYSLYDFSENGMAIIAEPDPVYGEYGAADYGFINKSGEVVISPQFSDARPFTRVG